MWGRELIVCAGSRVWPDDGDAAAVNAVMSHIRLS